jgi:hypothetical protein
MKKLLSLFRKKTYCIKLVKSHNQQGVEIYVNEFIRTKKVTPVNVSYTLEPCEAHGQAYSIYHACILYKF